MIDKKNYHYIYNKIILLTRKKSLYIESNVQDSAITRIYLALFYLGFVLKILKKDKNLKNFSQDLYDYFFSQIEINLREIGYGDVSVNKKMKSLVNLFNEIIIYINKWDLLKKNEIINYINTLFIPENNQVLNVDKLYIYLNNFPNNNKNNPLNLLSKGIIDSN